ASESQDAPALPNDGRTRVVIESVTPQIDDGHLAAKCTIGESVVVEANLFSDSHVSLSAIVKYRAMAEAQWSEVSMERVAGDRWRGEFTAAKIGEYVFTIES